MADTPDRNPLIDVVRVVSVLVVVAYHYLTFEVRWEGLTPRVSTVAVGPIGWVLSWILQVMPLFFLAGGCAHAVLVDKMAVEHTTYGQYLARRARRLLAPLGIFIAIMATVASVAGVWVTQPAAVASSQLTKVLWFLLTYLVIVVVAPTMVRLHDRFGAAVPVVLAVAAVAVDVTRFLTINDNFAFADGVSQLNLIVVWLACHQLGIGYQRGWLRRGPRGWPVAALAAGIFLIVVGIWGPYPITAVGFGDRTVSNLGPPSALMIALCLAQMGVLALFNRQPWPGLETTRAQRFLRLANGMLVAVYLWHIPVLAVGVALALWMSRQGPDAATTFLSKPVYLALALPLLAAAVPLLAGLEQRLLPPVGPAPSAPGLLTACGLLFVGTWAVWRYGLVVHPTQPWSSAGVLLIAAGALVLTIAARAR